MSELVERLRSFAQDRVLAEGDPDGFDVCEEAATNLESFERSFPIIVKASALIAKERDGLRKALTATQSEAARLRELLKQAVEALEAHEAWEAALILSPYETDDDTPAPGADLWNDMIDVQSIRNKALTAIREATDA